MTDTMISQMDNRPSDDAVIMTMAYLAAMRSKDVRTHVGAVIISPDRSRISTGRNGLPRGIDDHRMDRQAKGEKAFWMAHAERNALDNATYDVTGWSLFTMGVPCEACAIGIIQRGIGTVVVHKEWCDVDGSFERNHRSRTMFAERGIALRSWTGLLLSITALNDGVDPLKVSDPMAHDLLAQYAERRGAVDAEFERDLVEALAAFPEPEPEVKDG